jgi:hypothetical protein
VLNLPPDDGFGGSGIFVRLSTAEGMQKFEASSNVWLKMDDYYFGRAVEDPFFEEVIPLNQAN